MVQRYGIEATAVSEAERLARSFGEPPAPPIQYPFSLRIESGPRPMP